MRIVLVTLAVLALAGCGAQQKPGDTAATATPSGAPGAPATGSTTPGDQAGGGTGAVAAAPRMIEELTNQRLVYECPKCGMDFDAAGTCSMDGSELVATRVDYTCPQDGQAVAHAGRCPRCPMNARVEKTAMATAPAPAKN
jgi:predicted RNA-binding Zn-ribbon protein involved in translation (DUF1610 family)